MKTEISRDSHQPEKRYSGVYQQQGRMLTDADWNELVEILKERLNDALKDVIGNKAGSMGGTPRHRALKINDDLTIQPGHVYVDGIAALNLGDTPLAYDAQPDFPSPPGLPNASGLANKYIIYADVWERTVTHLMDDRLRDKGLHGADTCTRKQKMAQVKWCPSNIDPESLDKNPSKGNAKLTVTLQGTTTQPDPCDPCAAELDVESKTGNYLFRVEVHDVKGDANNPSEVTLKWSSENGAEQYALKDAEGKDVEPPSVFKSGDWIYEFFDETSEKHLGVHLENITDWKPARGILKKQYKKPKEGPNRFVRRWDGYATFRWDTMKGGWSIPDDYGINRGVNLTEDSSSTLADKVLKLDSVELKLQLLNRVIGGPVTSDSLGGNSLLDADLVINGKLIKCNQSSAKEKAAAIKDADASVIATVITVLEGSAPSEMGDIDAGNLKVNGKDIGKIFAADNVKDQADVVVDAINEVFSTDDYFSASKTPEGSIVLTATDGRNIEVNVTGEKTSKRCGFERENNRLYDSITLTSTSPLNPNITIAGRNPGYAGFVRGTTPAVRFVAGDYWLAEVREAEHKVDSVLIENKAPQGIEHHYLKLAEIKADGTLKENPEADRKYAFPSLTEMTRMFIAGGDGQEVVPGDPLKPLPQLLRVGVANGEWPVEGAKVRFQIENGGGSLSPVNSGKTNADGIAECEWTPGDIKINPPTPWPKFEVKATLVDPDNPAQDLDHPPVFFYANLVSADQVAYDPGCPDSGENAVHSHLVTDSELDLGDDNYYTVKEVLDALLCKLRAKHIPYDPKNLSRWKDVNEEESEAVNPPPPDTVQQAIDNLLENLHSEDITYPLPVCDSTAYGAKTLKKLLESEILPKHNTIDHSGRFRIRVLWDALLCHLDASKLPYNPTLKGTRWEDINEEGAGGPSKPETVQDAIDNIVENLESTDISYEVPNCGTAASPTIRSLLPIAEGNRKIDEIFNKLLCDFKATHLPIDKNEVLCDTLNQAEIKTVQDALNALCKMERGCVVTVGKGGKYPTLKAAFNSEELKKESQISICLLPRTEIGTHTVENLVVSGKESISITGHDVIVYVQGHLSLEAYNVTLSGIRFSVTDNVSRRTGTGSITLSSPSDSKAKDGNIVVEHCQFSRVFYGEAPKWRSLVTVGKQTSVKWVENRMYAKRQYEEIRSAAIPDRGQIPDDSLEIYDALAGMWHMDPYEDPDAFKVRATAVAEKISGLSSATREQWYAKRPVSRINELPDTPIRVWRPTIEMGRLERPPGTGGLEPVPGRVLPSPLPGRVLPSPLPGLTARLAQPTVFSEVSPKVEVNKFYELLKSAGPINVNVMVDAIHTVAVLINRFDYALALESNDVGGWITDNEIQGYLALHYDQNDADQSKSPSTLKWPSTVADDRQANKTAWANENLTPDWLAKQQLFLQGNKFGAVHSMIPEEKLKSIHNMLESGGGAAKDIQAYESITVRDNIFYEDDSSFIGKFMTISGNQFFYQNEKGAILTYALGVRGTFLGNMSYAKQKVGSRKYKIEQIINESVKHGSINILDIV